MDSACGPRPIINSHWRRGRDCSALRASSLRDRRRYRSGVRAAASRRLVEPDRLFLGFEPLLPINTANLITVSLALINRYRLAEREGFEPSNTFWDVTHFPGERLRPLGHLSTRVARVPDARRPSKSSRGLWGIRRAVNAPPEVPQFVVGFAAAGASVTGGGTAGAATAGSAAALPEAATLKRGGESKQGSFSPSGGASTSTGGITSALCTFGASKPAGTRNEAT